MTQIVRQFYYTIFLSILASFQARSTTKNRLRAQMEPINVRFANPHDLDFIYNSLVELFTEAHVIKRFSVNRTRQRALLYTNRLGIINQ